MAWIVKKFQSFIATDRAGRVDVFDGEAKIHACGRDWYIQDIHGVGQKYGGDIGPSHQHQLARVFRKSEAMCAEINSDLDMATQAERGSGKSHEGGQR